MKQLAISTMQMILGEMERLQKEHPKATVLYDQERDQILITYPLPVDYFKLKEVGIKELKDK